MKYIKANNILSKWVFLLVASFVLVACQPANTNNETIVDNHSENSNNNHNDNANNHAENNEADTHDDSEEHTEELIGDMVRGGKLYDKFWNVAAPEDDHDHDTDHDESASAPEGDHPLWATQESNARSGSDTWRCKECHGWDYLGVDGAYSSGSHMTGFLGINAMAGVDPAEILEVMKGSKNENHDFSVVMSEQDLIDISLFVSEGQIDYGILVSNDKSSTGNAVLGEETYTGLCEQCHGVDGNAINFGAIDDPEYLGHVAPGNPWEFIHKVRFGQPGWPMPSAVSAGWTLEEIANVLAYSQTFPEESFVSWGGQIYDKWWVVLGLDEPAEDQALWATQENNTRTGKDTWRCKECHGWDYLGVDGAYSSGSHNTGFAGILAAAGYSTEDIIAWLDGTNNPDHAFPFDDVGFNAMATFIQTTMIDISAYINEDKSAIGDPLSGRDMWEGTCQFCHGADGKLINFGHDDDPEYVGTVASGNPWEFIHKVAQGQPGSPMPSGLALGWTIDEIIDLLSFAQTLPTE